MKSEQAHTETYTGKELTKISQKLREATNQIITVKFETGKEIHSTLTGYVYEPANPDKDTNAAYTLYFIGGVINICRLNKNSKISITTYDSSN